MPRLAGAALLCSAPPSGNSALVRRLMRQSPLLAARLTWCACTRPFKEHVCRVRVGEALQRSDNWCTCGPMPQESVHMFLFSCRNGGKCIIIGMAIVGTGFYVFNILQASVQSRCAAGAW